MNQNRSFFAKLFDFSFSTFIAPQIVGVLYALGLLGAILIALRGILSALQYDFLLGLGTLVVSAFGLLIYTIFLRVSLESFVAIIRTAESTRILAENALNNTAADNLNS